MSLTATAGDLVVLYARRYLASVSYRHGHLDDMMRPRRTQMTKVAATTSTSSSELSSRPRQRLRLLRHRDRRYRRTSTRCTSSAGRVPLDPRTGDRCEQQPRHSLATGTASDLVTATLSRFNTTNATTNRTYIYNDHVTSTLGARRYHSQRPPAPIPIPLYPVTPARTWSVRHSNPLLPAAVARAPLRSTTSMRPSRRRQCAFPMLPAPLTRAQIYPFGGTRLDDRTTIQRAKTLYWT